MRDWVAVSLAWVVGGGPAFSMIASVRCCKAIVRVVLIWLGESGAGGVGVRSCCAGTEGSMTMVATR